MVWAWCKFKASTAQLLSPTLGVPNSTVLCRSDPDDSLLTSLGVDQRCAYQFRDAIPAPWDPNVHPFYPNYVPGSLPLPLRDSLSYVGVTDSPLCRACMEKNETPTHVMLECTGVTEQREIYLGSPATFPEVLSNLGGMLGFWNELGWLE
ncbi:jg1536 [Pararge aegeria aegeria]|uniref:Jg1536 protein n=1 Tax=Pararge aegeria aegeria TaxID=348720 RepID=A0A8S4RHA5_9NEOP|nr:jg1536 [Pararge aegeria aegeria]